MVSFWLFWVCVAACDCSGIGARCARRGDAQGGGALVTHLFVVRIPKFCQFPGQSAVRAALA
jgi:hypothetical protein